MLRRICSATQFMASKMPSEKGRHDDFSDLVVMLILASGLSSRLGQPKMLLPWTSGTILDTLISRILQETVQPLVVVSHPDLPLTVRDSRVNYVLNDSPHSGISHSIRLAVAFVQQKWPKASVAVLLGDEPFVLGQDIHNMMFLFQQRPISCHCLRPRYNQIPGHPVMFDQEALSWTEELTGDRGFGALWAQHANAACCVDLNVRDRPNPAIDIDTPTDYRMAYNLAVKMEGHIS